VPGTHCDPSQALGCWVTPVPSVVPVSLLAVDVGSLQAVSPRCVEAKVPVPDPVSSELQRTVSNLCKTSERVLAVLGDFRGKKSESNAGFAATVPWAQCACPSGFQAEAAPSWALQELRAAGAGNGLCF